MSDLNRAISSVALVLAAILGLLNVANVPIWAIAVGVVCLVTVAVLLLRRG
jgi:hypothetical protein